MQIKNIEGLSVSQIKDIVKDGGKFVYFPYTVSIVLATFKRSSSVYLIKSGESAFKHSYKHVLVNGVLGWWAIPWGPIHTVTCMYNQFSGGKVVTDEIMSHLIQNDPDADTSTYNINNMMSSNTTSGDQPTYNIPR